MSDQAPAEARWAPGTSITLRYVGHSHGRERGRPGLLQGWPYTVVRDAPDLLALWMPAGTRMALVDLADRSRAIPDLVHGEHPTLAYRRGDKLRLMRPGRAHSIWLHWSTEPPHEFLGYYVNLEAPHVRTAVGVDTTDDSLDLVVWPDLAWEWKDEALVDHWINLGVYTREEFDRIYDEGRRVIAEVETRRPPFDNSWLDFRPDPAWPVPSLAPGWDAVPGYDMPLSTGRRLTGLDPAFEASRSR